MLNIKAIVGGIVAIIVLLSVVYIQNVKNSSLVDKLEEAEQKAEGFQKSIELAQSQNRKLAIEAERLQGEYEEAQNEISQLDVDLRNESKRLRISAVCPVPSKSSTRSVDDERYAELTEDAQRAYINHAREIGKANAIINGLRSYIRAMPSACVATNE